jgi:DNA-binding NarL/FixJ family response regulator
MPHRILVVEDDPPTRRHLVRAIEAHPELDLVRAAGTVAEGRSALAEEQPDVLLTDIGLPDGTGIDLIRAIREVAPKAISMAVTALGDEKTVISAIEAGASGYLLKDGSHDEIGGAVLELVAGGSPISPSIARHVLQRLHREDAEADEESENDAPTLTAREHEVLTLIAKGFSFPEIAELLEISAHTVTTHVRHTYEKLEVNSRGSAVYEAVNLGLIQMD